MFVAVQSVFYIKLSKKFVGFCVNAAPVHDNLGKIMLFYKYDDSNLNLPCTLVSIIQEAVNDKVSVFLEKLLRHVQT